MPICGTKNSSPSRTGVWALSQELLAKGQSVILEWGHWARVERDEKRLGARALGVGVELHYLDVPLEELIARANVAMCRASGQPR